MQTVDEILKARLQEPGTFIDGLQLSAFADTAKSPSISKEEREKALESLKEYKPNDDPFE